MSDPVAVFVWNFPVLEDGMKTVRSACLLALVGVITVTPQHINAQQWSPEQQEVWDAEVACLDAGMDNTRKACMHPDFMGWGVQQPVPTAYSEEEFDYYFAHNTLRVIEATPLHILVEGDIAIIQLMVQTWSSLDRGPDEESWVAWTDIMKRENGVWRWIADHGHAMGGSN